MNTHKVRRWGIALAVCTAIVAGSFVWQTARSQEVGQYLPVYSPTFAQGTMSLSGSAREAEGMIVLTDDASQQTGSAFAAAATLQDDRAFSAEFSFRMPTAQGATPGNGLSFVLRAPGVSAQNGYAGMKDTLCVEFDTYTDTGLLPEAEPEGDHVAFLLNGEMDQPVAVRTLAAPLSSGETYHAWVDYTNGVLELRLDTVAVRPVDAFLSAAIEPGRIPQKVEAGFVAQTGETRTSAHIVSSMLFAAQYRPLTANAAYVSGAELTLSLNRVEEEAGLGNQCRFMLTAMDGFGRSVAGVPISLGVNNGARTGISSGITDEQGSMIVEVFGGETTNPDTDTILQAFGPQDATAKAEISGLDKNTPPEVQQASPYQVFGYEDQRVRFPAGLFEMYYIDADDDPFAGIVITERPEVGELLLGDEIVPQNAMIAGSLVDQLEYLPPAGYSTEAGKALKLSWSVSDGLATSTGVATCEIEIRHVNHAPTFSHTGDVGLSRSSVREREIEGWAYDISPGAPGESDQTLTFEVLSNDNPELFEEQPTISANGTLRFVIAEGGQGIARLRVVLRDDGGTSDGGVDVSDLVEFSIRFDDEPPTIQLPVLRSGWINVAIWNELSCVDTGSGVKEFEYAVTANEEAPQEYDSRPPEEESGVFYLHVRAQDHAGNQARRSYGPFQVDRESPETPAIKAEISGGKLVATATSKDAHSGVQKYQFGINGMWLDPTVQGRMERTELTANTVYTVSVRALDGAENVSGIATTRLITPPNQPKLTAARKDGAMILTIDPCGNAADTLYQIERIDKRTGQTTKMWEGSTALVYSDEVVSGAQYRIAAQPKVITEEDAGAPLVQARK